MSLDVLSVQWLIDGSLRRSQLGSLEDDSRKGNRAALGKMGEGKTCTAIDLALSICAGEPFAGRRTKSAGVLYLAVERGDGTAPPRATLRATRGATQSTAVVGRAVF